MWSMKTSLLAAILFLGSLSSHFAQAEELIASGQSLEYRLQKLNAKRHETERLHLLFELYWDWHLDEFPDEATCLGYPGDYGRWPDLSSQAFERHLNFTSQLLDALARIDETSLEEEDDQISYRILERILEDDQANTQFGNQYLIINQMQGIHLFVPMVIELMPSKTVEDYENILSRLRLIPNLFKQSIDLLDKGIELGITPPRIALLNVPQQILNQIVDDPMDSPFLKAFKEIPSSIDAATQSRLLNEAQAIYLQCVCPSLKQLYSYVSEKYIPCCRQSIAFTDLPKGESWYAHLVQSSTTTSLTPQEIHTIGLQEVKRIHEEMLSVIKSTGFHGSFEQFLKFIKTDPQFFFSKREEILEGYQNLTRDIESKLHLLFTTLPALPFKVIPVPSYSEESQVAAYYCPGSIKDNRPGYFFINTSYVKERPKWEMEPLSLHEAVPGHHLQISLAQELQGLPEFRKNATFTAYVEGWGLYAESLGEELGLYQDPYSKFGRLSYEMLRAIRLVVDTGMHAMGWSRDQAIDFFKQYVGMGNHEIETEIDRYLVIPGQALAYKIGELKIQEMRRLAKQSLRDKFDIRTFHQAWLQYGTVPLDIAEQQIQQWILELRQQALEVQGF